jgi:hypothetical protein
MKLRGNALEVSRHLVGILRFEQPPRQLLRVRVRRRADGGSRGVDCVDRAPELHHTVLEQRPECPLLPLVRDPDASCVDEADSVDHSLELHVRVPADHDFLLDPRQRRAETIVGRHPGQDLVVVARRAVTVENAVQGDRERHGPKELVRGLVQLRRQPLPRAFRSPWRLPVGVAADEDRLHVTQPVEALLRIRTGDHVAAAHDPIDVEGTYVREHGL